MIRSRGADGVEADVSCGGLTRSENPRNGS